MGWGRHGCTFKASKDGTGVAIKQFDVTKNPGAYEEELDAYRLLKERLGYLGTEAFVSFRILLREYAVFGYAARSPTKE
jgi:hypothetical protein